jgi:alpha-glucosidase
MCHSCECSPPWRIIKSSNIKHLGDTCIRRYDIKTGLCNSLSRRTQRLKESLRRISFGIVLKQIKYLTYSLFLVAFILSSSFSQWESLKDVTSYKRNINNFIFDCGGPKISVKVLSNSCIQIKLAKNGKFSDEFSWAVIKKELPLLKTETKETFYSLSIFTEDLIVEVTKSPCRIIFMDKKRNIINSDNAKGIEWNNEKVRCWKIMPGKESYYGFGEKTGTLRKNKSRIVMWNRDIPEYTPSTDSLYQSIPFFIGLRNGKSYGIYFDNTYRTIFDMGKESNIAYYFEADGGEMIYYFLYGPEMKNVVSQFSDLVGKMPLPPKWAIGYQQCRWSYYPESKVRSIAENFRKRNIPCDVLYLDIDYMDGYRCFTWNKNHFPDPKNMVNDLAKEGFKFVVIIDPGIKQDTSYWVYKQGLAGDYYVKTKNRENFIGKVWPGECVFPDFTNEKVRKWWGGLYKDLIDVGIKGFWNDMNEPSVFDVPEKTMPPDNIHFDNGKYTDHRKNHNIYGMQMARGTYEGCLELRPNERPFVLTRASFTGGNRYAAAWTGDNVSSWEHAKLAIPMCLNFGLSGQPFTGMDIGGFVSDPSGELYSRWLQYAALFPLCRTHSVINSKDKEPWSYGEKFENINRKSIELRYRLLPYLYTLFYESSVKGLPIIRPLILEYPDDQNVLDIDDEFLLGRDLLIAPVLKENAKERTVYFPEGVWYDFFTNDKYIGPMKKTIPAPIEKIPIFVREGSIIPTQQIVQYTDQEPINPLTFNIYSNGKMECFYYEDDGISFDYKNGKYYLLNITSNFSKGKTKSNTKLEINISKPSGLYIPLKRNFEFIIHNIERFPGELTVSGIKYNITKSIDPKTTENEFQYDSKNKTVKFFIQDENKELKISIE